MAFLTSCNMLPMYPSMQHGLLYGPPSLPAAYCGKQVNTNSIQSEHTFVSAFQPVGGPGLIVGNPSVRVWLTVPPLFFDGVAERSE